MGGGTKKPTANAVKRTEVICYAGQPQWIHFQYAEAGAHVTQCGSDGNYHISMALTYKWGVAVIQTIYKYSMYHKTESQNQQYNN